MTWFSSGGTKSVLHNDDVDNINCLLRGKKQLLFIDYNKYKTKVGSERTCFQVDKISTIPNSQVSISVFEMHFFRYFLRCSKGINPTH